MISVNDLIQNAFSRCGLVGDGQAVNGTKAKTGENELKDLISVLNTQEYIADNYRMFDVGGKNEITIGDSIDFDIQIKNPPSTIKSIGRKQGDRFVQLLKTNVESIFSRSRNHLSTQYTYNVYFDEKALKSKTIKPSFIVSQTESELPQASMGLVRKKGLCHRYGQGA
ncbi:hypothetical protein [Fibrobacter sp. UWB2]|uniref:hypothetical protein n=1 Tax=Fibrobacter sp. UWB2 TaxID=1964358 RepID=UPI000B521FE1|nr:hypothetical protein [Fibrobacter sp. UWB2]